MKRFQCVFFTLLICVGFIYSQDVTVSITNVSDGMIEVSMDSDVAVGGFQFTVNDDPELLTVQGASGGMAGSAGFMMSTNESGMVLGFSLTGATIPAGVGVLCNVEANFSGDSGNLSLTGAVFSDQSGNALEVEVGPDYYFGDPPPPCVTISNTEVEGEELTVTMSNSGFGDGDHYHAYLDGNMMGMFYSDTFSFSIDCEGAEHALTVTAVDGSHSEYDDECSSESVGITASSEDCAGECGGDAMEDCDGECGGGDVIDCAGECCFFDYEDFDVDCCGGYV